MDRYARTSARVTRNGRVTIPKQIRELLALDAGTRIHFVVSEPGALIIPIKADLRSMCGMFKGRRTRAATIDEIDPAATELAIES